MNRIKLQKRERMMRKSKLRTFKFHFKVKNNKCNQTLHGGIKQMSFHLSNSEIVIVGDCYPSLIKLKYLRKEAL